MKVTEQMNVLTQSIGKMKELMIPPEEPSGIKKDGQAIGEIQPKPNAFELKKDWEAQAKEIEKKLFEKMKTYRGTDGLTKS